MRAVEPWGFRGWLDRGAWSLLKNCDRSSCGGADALTSLRLPYQPVKKPWTPPFHQKPGADEARRRRISLMDLRLRSNEVAARFLMKPFGLRSFLLCALSLLGHKSIRMCSLVASRTKPKILSAVVFIVFYRAAKAACTRYSIYALTVLDHCHQCVGRLRFLRRWAGCATSVSAGGFYFH